VIHKIDHIAIAVSDLDGSIAIFRDVLGLTYMGEETVAEQKVRIAFFSCGDVSIELTSPTAPDSPVAGFIEKRGGGLHHIAFEVDSIRKEIAQFKEKGIKMLNDEPKTGAHQSLIAFIHPKSIANVLVELKETTVLH